MWGLKPKKTYCQNICVGFRVIKDTLFEWLKMGKTCLTVSDWTWSFGIKVGPGLLQWDCLVQSSETFLRLPTSCQQTRIICNFLVLLRVSKTFVMQQSKLGKHFSIESSEAFCKTLQPTLWGRHTHVGGSIKSTSRLDGKIWNLHSVPCATMHPWRVLYMHGTPPEMNDESIITHHFPSQENRAWFILQNRIWLISRRR